MKTIPILLFAAWCVMIAGCTSVKTPVTNQYQLNAYNQEVYTRQHTALSILVTKPESTAGYETEQMLYVDKPYALSPFAHSAWIDPPADMLFPLMVQSLQASGYFYGVASNLSSDGTDYRLDTQLIELRQNFLHKPSVLEFTAKVVLSQVSDNAVIASRVIRIRRCCSSNTPYGGVLAANQASQQFTREVTRFVIDHVRKERDRHNG